MRRKQMSRRALLRVSGRAGVGAAGLALVGCGGGDDDDSVSQVAQQQQQQQQQAMQQQAGQQQRQQAMPLQAQQEQEEQSAAQQAQQAEQQEATPAEQEEEQQQQAVAGGEVPKYGGTFRLGSGISTHAYWDPHRGVFGETQFMHGWVYNYVIRWANKEQAIMASDLAELPEIPDGETYIFSVVDGARWHDRYPTEGGREVTANDIDYNIERQVNGFDSTGSEDSTFRSSSRWRRIASRGVIDERTIALKSDGTDSTFLSASVLNPYGWIAAPEGIDEWGYQSDVWRDEQTVLRVAGSGPFIAESYDPTDRFVVPRNPDYWKYDAWGQQLPYLDGLDYIELFEQTALETAFRNKELEAVNLNVATVEALQNDFPQLVKRITPDGNTIQCRSNFNPDWPGEDGLGNPWVDRRMWAAFHVATDRYLMIDAVALGSAKPSALPRRPGSRPSGRPRKTS